MKNLNQMINDTCIKSKAMRKTSWELNYDDAMALRKQQNEVYKKWLFLKNMKKAIEKVGKEGQI